MGSTGPGILMGGGLVTAAWRRAGQMLVQTFSSWEGCRVSPAVTRPSPLRQIVREDFETHRRAKLSPGFHALAVYRFGTSIPPGNGWRSRGLRRAHRLAAAFVEAVYGIELPLSADIGRRLSLPHPQGVVFVGGVRIGDDCMVRHNVTLGAASTERDGVPTVGDRVHFGPGSIVMGSVRVGNDARIGPGAVVISDVPPGSRVLAPVATIVGPEGRARSRSSVQSGTDPARGSDEQQ